MVRDQDRIQARLNENKRRAFFQRQENLLEKSYEKRQKREVATCNHCKADRECENHTWEVYEEYMEAQILKMWRRLGYTDRDWIKSKVIYFNE